MIKKYFFFIFIVIAAISLIIIALNTMQKEDAIIAVVESQKTAISYRKPVTIKAIHVNAGQKVKKGDLLLEVERPDLVLDYEKLVNQKAQVQNKKSNLEKASKNKVELLQIEKNGKLQRLSADIAQLEVEIKQNQALKSNFKGLDNNSSSETSTVGFNDPDSIKLVSYQSEIKQIKTLYNVDIQRVKSEAEEEAAVLDLEVQLIDNELTVLKLEESELKKMAPFDGTIGTVNGQINEIVPSFQTIVSLFEEHPTMIKAYVNMSSNFNLTPGDSVYVESSNREYKISGNIIEVGARIVSYKNPADPINVPDKFGREIFIKLPENNSFLYGEHVFVFPANKK
ncbi:MAG: HlyD family efflux transporter periplasmic adaptor subunit [Bacteroidota bacterium]